MRTVQEVADGTDIAASTPLMEAGVDSLAATELSSRLRTASGLLLSPTLVFEQPTPRAIATHILEQLVDSTGPVIPSWARAAPSGTDTAVAIGWVVGRWPGGCSTDAALCRDGTRMW